MSQTFTCKICGNILSSKPVIKISSVTGVCYICYKKVPPEEIKNLILYQDPYQGTEYKP